MEHAAGASDCTSRVQGVSVASRPPIMNVTAAAMASHPTPNSLECRHQAIWQVVHLQKVSIMTSRLYTGPARDLYRAMRRDGNRPELTPNQLGVRTQGKVRDIRLHPDGAVYPDTGGMTVVPDDPMHMKRHHRPASLLGTGRKPVWSISSARIVNPLAIRQDTPKHWLIEPALPMQLQAFSDALADTAPFWQVSHE